MTHIEFCQRLLRSIEQAFFVYRSLDGESVAKTSQVLHLETRARVATFIQPVFQCLNVLCNEQMKRGKNEHYLTRISSFQNKMTRLLSKLFRPPIDSRNDDYEHEFHLMIGVIKSMMKE